jgi:hypothetical protein
VHRMSEEVCGKIAHAGPLPESSLGHQAERLKADGPRGPRCLQHDVEVWLVIEFPTFNFLGQLRLTHGLILCYVFLLTNGII